MPEQYSPTKKGKAALNATSANKKKHRRENLVHGPQSNNEAITQDDVDKMIGQDDIDSLFD